MLKQRFGKVDAKAVARLVARLDDDELAGLTTLLSRLDEGQDNAACEPPPD